MAAGLPWKSTLAAILLLSSCSTTPQRDINAVLQTRAHELTSLPGVVGVYAGQLPDHKTPCIKVMVLDAQTAKSGRFPKALEGYPVRLEVSGPIKPLR